jgi:hypothetical protein
MFLSRTYPRSPKLRSSMLADPSDPLGPGRTPTRHTLPVPSAIEELGHVTASGHAVAPPTRPMKSRRLMPTPPQMALSYRLNRTPDRGHTLVDVSVGSIAALTDPKSDFRFIPESGLKSDIGPCRKSPINSGRAHYSITSSARARSIGRIESDTARAAAGREEAEENWATTDGIKHPALSLWRGGVCKSARSSRRGAKSQTMRSWSA